MIYGNCCTLETRLQSHCSPKLASALPTAFCSWRSSTHYLFLFNSILYNESDKPFFIGFWVVVDGVVGWGGPVEQYIFQFVFGHMAKSSFKWYPTIAICQQHFYKVKKTYLCRVEYCMTYMFLLNLNKIHHFFQIQFLIF